jgi:hypothetical protein
MSQEILPPIALDPGLGAGSFLYPFCGCFVP